MPTIGNLGTMFVRGENKKLVPVPCIQGKNGITPHIGENGNWWIGDTDTGAMADNKKYPVSASVYEKIITGKPSEYTLEILLKDGERIRAELPNMGLTPDDVVEIGIGEPSEFDDINYKQFYLDKNTGRLYINTSKMYPNSYITIGGVVLSGENDPTGGEDAYINNLYVNTTTGAIFLCVRMESFMPSEPPHPVWQQIGGTGGDVGTDITLGITGAVVGQTVKITEVDENGKPTKWEAIEMASGGTSDAVQYISQELTYEQQMQTRENLGLYRKMVELKDSASVTVVKNSGSDAEIIGIKIYPITHGGAWEEGDTIRVEIGTYVFEGTVSIDAIGYQEYGVFVDLRIPIDTWANYYLRYDPLETKWTMSGDYEFTLETTETMRIYKVQLHPVPEEYIPDTIARKEDIDSTLSIEGAAADAKAVGNKVAELSSAIAELGGTLVEPAEDDIPKVFFGGALQQTKDVAVVPFRYISKTRDISGYAEIKAQGNSSMSYPKKNQTVKLFRDADCSKKLKVDFKGWGAQSKHVYKANWIDLSHARNVVSARLWADVVKSRAGYENLPELLRTSPNQGAVDGFPVKVYAAGVYQGRYTLNIPKDKWAFNMDDTLDNHCVLCGENYASGCFRAAANINGNDWSDEIHDVVPVSIKTRWNEVISFVMNSTDDEFKINLGQYFDIQSLIDYHLFGLQSCGLDAYGKNQIYMTYDGQKWIASMYDMDSTWGLYWNGSKFVATDYARTSYEDFVSTGSSGEGNLLYIRLEQLFWEELQTRWAELKNGALSIENIINRFERFTDIAPADLVAEDYANTTGGGSFTNIPSKTTNDIQQIRSFALARQAWTDEYVAGLTPEVRVPCTGISLSSETLTFTEAGTQTLTVTVEPEGCTDTVTWESSDTGVATVSGGIVTAVGNGGATITAICGGFSDTCAVSVSGIISGETSLVYSLPESTTFDGTNYIDTGIQLFDTLKDFTILLDYEEGVNIGSATIFHCINEISPYPGLCIQRNSDNVGDYVIGGRSSGGANFAMITSVATRVAITCTGGSITGGKYVENGDIVTVSISANSGTIFEKNLLLGCYQTASGNRGRYWKGTINKFDVYFSVLSDVEIDAWLTGK